MNTLKEHADRLRVLAQNDYMIDGKMLPAGDDLNVIAGYIEDRANVMTRDNEKDAALQTIGDSSGACLAEMVAALECDYDRLEELREMRSDWLSENPGNYLDPDDPRAKAGAHWALAFPDESEELAELSDAAGDCESREDAEQRIQEDPLSIEVRDGWYSPGSKEQMYDPEEFCILLGTGGPAVRIIGGIDENCPSRPRLQVQDWGTPWTDYRGDKISRDDLLTYCQQFYFGE